MTYPDEDLEDLRKHDGQTVQVGRTFSDPEGELPDVVVPVDDPAPLIVPRDRSKDDDEDDADE